MASSRISASRAPDRAPPRTGSSVTAGVEPLTAMTASLALLACLDRLLHGRAEVGRAVRDRDAGGAEGADLLLRRAAAAADDRAGVAHALARRRRLAGDERGDRLGHVLLDELGRPLLRRAADLAH